MSALPETHGVLTEGTRLARSEPSHIERPEQTYSRHWPRRRKQLIGDQLLRAAQIRRLVPRLAR